MYIKHGILTTFASRTSKTHQTYIQSFIYIHTHPYFYTNLFYLIEIIIATAKNKIKIRWHTYSRTL